MICWRYLETGKPLEQYLFPVIITQHTVVHKEGSMRHRANMVVQLERSN